MKTDKEEGEKKLKLTVLSDRWRNLKTQRIYK